MSKYREKIQITDWYTLSAIADINSTVTIIIIIY